MVSLIFSALFHSDTSPTECYHLIMTAYTSADEHMQSAHPYRQIRASYTLDTVTVYQAYSTSIATAAVQAGTFVSPFKRGRMTWIKPSFLWMMYRAGWGSKDVNQAHILEIDLKREGFEEALRMARLSHYDVNVHGPDKDAWEEETKNTKSPVVIQWDPERDCRGRALAWRSLQLGMRAEAVDKYVDEWIVGIRDVTGMCKEIKQLVEEGEEAEAYECMPEEGVYELPSDLVRHIGITMPS
jgi:hypothetical protein